MKINSFLSRWIKRDLDSRKPISNILCNVKIDLKKNISLEIKIKILLHE